MATVQISTSTSIIDSTSSKEDTKEVGAKDYSVSIPTSLSTTSTAGTAKTSPTKAPINETNHNKPKQSKSRNGTRQSLMCLRVLILLRIG